MSANKNWASAEAIRTKVENREAVCLVAELPASGRLYERYAENFLEMLHLASPLILRGIYEMGRWVLVGLPCVVLFAVHIGMVFERFQVGRDFSWHSQLDRQAFFQNCGATVGLAD